MRFMDGEVTVCGHDCVERGRISGLYDALPKPVFSDPDF
jgi:hypothetical protein